MTSATLPLSTSVFSVDVASIARHANPVPCVIAGRRGAISVISGSEQVTGDVLFIRPGIDHKVVCAGGGIHAMYLNGLTWPAGAPFAQRLQGSLAQTVGDAFLQKPDCQSDVPQRLAFELNLNAQQLSFIIADIISEPMSRMTQGELARRMKMERTRALRVFKAATGQTFRQYKQWFALQHAARRIEAGELVRTAAMDAGFADTAHLTRTFRKSFGLTPSEAIAGLAQAASP